MEMQADPCNEKTHLRKKIHHAKLNFMNFTKEIILIHQTINFASFILFVFSLVKTHYSFEDMNKKILNSLQFGSKNHMRSFLFSILFSFSF